MVAAWYGALLRMVVGVGPAAAVGRLWGQTRNADDAGAVGQRVERDRGAGDAGLIEGDRGAGPYANRPAFASSDGCSQVGLDAIGPSYGPPTPRLPGAVPQVAYGLA
jgi:hypothetical protein